MTRRRRYLLGIVGAGLWGAAMAGGCVPPATGGTSATGPAVEFGPVYLLGTELLEPPAVGNEVVFRAQESFAVDPGDPAAGRAVGFFVTLAAEQAGELRARLSDRASGAARALRPVSPPVSTAELEASHGPRPFNDTVRGTLRAGDGVFWRTAEAGPPVSSALRLAVMIPEALLSPFTKLDFFASQGLDGTPLRGAALELVEGFYYLAIIGDSIQWGNGLREEDKMSALVAEVLERETGKKVIRQRYAHSGARIVPAEGDSICEVDCGGEVPTASTSITVQADLIKRPDLLDFVLMDGCINDVDVGVIINPATTNEELQERSRQFCGDEMTALLGKIRALAPQAAVVVTGYFQIVGPDSDLFGLRQWVQTQEITPLEDDARVVAELTEQSVVFRDAAHADLRAAIDAVNAMSPDPPSIAFADPGFGPEHAIFTSDRWLWSMTADAEFLQDVGITLALAPEDQMVEFRKHACFQPDTIDGLISCLYVSVGHPNPAGARAYGDAIVEALRGLGVL